MAHENSGLALSNGLPGTWIQVKPGYSPRACSGSAWVVCSVIWPCSLPSVWLPNANQYCVQPAMLALVRVRIPAPKGEQSTAISGAVWLLQQQDWQETGFVYNSRLKTRGWWTTFIAESGLHPYLFGRLSFLGLNIFSFKSLILCALWLGYCAVVGLTALPFRKKHKWITFVVAFEEF